MLNLGDTYVSSILYSIASRVYVEMPCHRSCIDSLRKVLAFYLREKYLVYVAYIHDQWQWLPVEPFLAHITAVPPVRLFVFQGHNFPRLLKHFGYASVHHDIYCHITYCKTFFLLLQQVGLLASHMLCRWTDEVLHEEMGLCSLLQRRGNNFFGIVGYRNLCGASCGASYLFLPEVGL